VAFSRGSNHSKDVLPGPLATSPDGKGRTSGVKVRGGASKGIGRRDGHCKIAWRGKASVSDGERSHRGGRVRREGKKRCMFHDNGSLEGGEAEKGKVSKYLLAERTTRLLRRCGVKWPSTSQVGRDIKSEKRGPLETARRTNLYPDRRPVLTTRGGL